MSRRQPFFSLSVGSNYLKAFTGLSLVGYDSAAPGVRGLGRTLAEGFARPSWISSALHCWLGIDRSGWAPVLRKIGWTLAAVLAVGFLSIALCFLFFEVRS